MLLPTFEGCVCASMSVSVSLCVYVYVYQWFSAWVSDAVLGPMLLESIRALARGGEN